MSSNNFFDHFINNIDEIRDRIIKKIEKEENIFVKKSPYDNIKCVVCGSYHIRHSINKHKKTNKHQKNLSELSNSLKNFIKN
jgi:hypothetical protein